MPDSIFDNDQNGELSKNRGGSLDRHLLLSAAGELFSESKMSRVNSSLTSLSTPSFRIYGDGDIKAPIFMGLALPKHFHMIFLMDTPKPLHVRMDSTQTPTGSSLDFWSSNAGGCCGG